MARFVSVHTWMPYGPNAHNLDEQKQPKHVVVGGTTRERTSSQALRHARRVLMEDRGLSGSVRTRLLAARLARELLMHGRDLEEAVDVARAGLQSIGLGFVDDEKKPELALLTQYPLFVGDREIDGLVGTLHLSEVWDVLLAAAAVERERKAEEKRLKEEAAAAEAAALEAGTPISKRKAAPKRSNKKALRSAPDTKVASGLLRANFNPFHTPAVALWGRMFADSPDLNCTGAVYDAHSVGVAEWKVQDDFWTAADSLGATLADNRGAAAIGTAQFSAELMYGQSTVHMPQLSANLGNDDAFARQVLEAYLWAVVEAIPGGHLHTMASNPLPSLTVVECGDRQPTSLIEHCYMAVSRWEAGGDLVAATVARADKYLSWRQKTYGGRQGTLFVAGRDLPVLGLNQMPMEDLIAQVLTA